MSVNTTSEKTRHEKPKSPTKKREGGEHFSISIENGKNLLPKDWGDVGKMFKHKGDHGREKDKKIATYTNTIYYAASIFAYWTWCNNQVGLAVLSLLINR